MDENGNLISKPENVSNVFNDYFSTLGATVQSKIPTEPGSYNSYLNKCGKDGKPFINPNGCSFFSLPLVLMKCRR